MSMNDLATKKLFRLLSGSSQVEISVIHDAYESFVGQITDMNNTESDYSKAFRLLNHSFIEFDSLAKVQHSEVKKGGILNLAIFKEP